MKKPVGAILTGLAVVGLGAIAYKNKETITKGSKELKEKVKDKGASIKKEAKEALNELSDDCVCENCVCSTKEECLKKCVCDCCE